MSTTTKRKSSITTMDMPPTRMKAWEILESLSWGPICFAKREDGFGLKEVPVVEATVLSAYAALCWVYPDVSVRGRLIMKLRQFTNDQTLSQWEAAEGRTQAEVVALLKKVE